MSKEKKVVAKGTVDNGSDALPQVKNEIVDTATDHNGIVGDVTQDGVFIPRDGAAPVELDGDDEGDEEELG